MPDTTIDHLAEIQARAEAAAADPFFVSDCEGDLSVWRESALIRVRRDDQGEIDMYSTPSSYRVIDHVIEIELDTWDEGEDKTDDQRRDDIKDLVTARDKDRPFLLGHAADLHGRLTAAEAQLRSVDERYSPVHEAIDAWRTGGLDAERAMRRIAQAVGRAA